MTTADHADATDTHSTSFDRRTVLKMAGGTALAVSVVSGTASAHESKFFGCERVSSGTDGDFAVVSVDDGYECREMVNEGPRRDVPWDWDAHTYVAEDGEAVVGYIAEDEVKGDERANEGCWLCVNPNACAEDHYDSAEQIRADLDSMTCGPCGSDVNISVGCDPAADSADESDTDESDTDDGSETMVGTTTPDESENATAGDPEQSDSTTEESERFERATQQLNRLFKRVGFGFWS